MNDITSISKVTSVIGLVITLLFSDCKRVGDQHNQNNLKDTSEVIRLIFEKAFEDKLFEKPTIYPSKFERILIFEENDILKRELPELGSFRSYIMTMNQICNVLDTAANDGYPFIQVLELEDFIATDSCFEVKIRNNIVTSNFDKNGNRRIENNGERYDGEDKCSTTGLRNESSYRLMRHEAKPKRIYVRWDDH